MILKIKSALLTLFFPPFFLMADSNPIQEKIDQSISTYMEDHDITGVSVAVIGRENFQKFQKTISKGTLSKKSPIPVNHHTEFRIGPLTQIFSAAVLAYLVYEKQVSLNDPVSKFLPKSMKVPTYQGKQMTLKDLATHTSGLPDMPYSLSNRSSFSVSQMYRFLSKYELIMYFNCLIKSTKKFSY